ncbi:hypothetical protein HTZ84_08045 [Haloterrigena sp. SYSU A558-1]|uniref:Uncharacterized protein n=1 Tax=Haloterrigena gelatinilytica TaxID=2741724 RepID=A0ABX2L7R5_9EURY|nr:hypothetical protein [Haloterrigena gelatinilytica]NUC72262.1 hypothetical protein [Haloterrigena gelatinilytica]
MARDEERLLPSPLIGDFIATVLDGEEIVAEVTNLELFESGSYDGLFHYRDGKTFYRVEKTVLEKGTAAGREYELSRRGHSADTSEADVVPLSSLPYYDQLLLHNSLSLSDTGGVRVFSETFVAGYLDSGYREESRLADGIDFERIEFDGRYVRIEDRGESSAPQERVRYSAEAVAEGDAAFREYILERYAIEATDLSERAQDFLDSVLENAGSLLISTDDENFESQERALEEIRSLASKRTPLGDLNHPRCNRALYLRYEGEGYTFVSRDRVS